MHINQKPAEYTLAVISYKRKIFLNHQQIWWKEAWFKGPTIHSSIMTASEKIPVPTHHISELFKEYFTKPVTVCPSEVSKYWLLNILVHFSYLQKGDFWSLPHFSSYCQLHRFQNTSSFVNVCWYMHWEDRNGMLFLKNPDEIGQRYFLKPFLYIIQQKISLL